MKFKFILFAAVLQISVACSAVEIDLIDQKIVSTIIENNQSAQIKSITVFFIDGNVIIKGTIEQPERYYSFSKIRGHIDVEIIAPGIPKINLLNISIYSHRLFKKGRKRTSFSAYYPRNLSRGTVIRLKLHQAEHKNI